jgi:hypothetical protein
MCEACIEMEYQVNAIEKDRKRIADAIRQMQKANASNFISGNEVIDIVYNQRIEDRTNTYKGWD